MRATNAATFCETIEAKRMKDVPIYRDYIPDADPAEIAAMKKPGPRALPYIEEQKQAIYDAMGDETLALGVIAERVKMGKWTVCKRLQTGPFVNVRKGIWKRYDATT